MAYDWTGERVRRIRFMRVSMWTSLALMTICIAWIL